MRLSKGNNSKYAICSEGIYFFYDKVNRKVILDSVDIHVEKGKIYGLLGPSGCGKTTLLQCIVGHHKPSSGILNVRGKVQKIGQKNAKFTSLNIGFMPQELALPFFLSVEEIMMFFGRIYQMEWSDISQRIKLLVDLLDIPDITQVFEHLSGGQKRRVSLAVALLHNASLLILDEPTVGFDSLLRKSIWSYLYTLSEESKVTVIITTHYIEEAKQAHTVGLMRNGRLLIEMNPSALINQFEVSTLEEAFLKVCKRDSENRMIHKSEANKKTIRHKGDGFDLYRDWHTDEEEREGKDLLLERNYGNKLKSTIIRLTAFIRKDINANRRYKLLQLSELLLPILSAILCCSTIGLDPHHLPMATVNMDTSSYRYGRTFLDSLDNHFIIQEPYVNLSEGLKSIRQAKSYGVIYIDSNFSSSLTERFMNFVFVNNETINQSMIRIYLDCSNNQIAYIIYRKVYEAFNKFSTDMLNNISLNPRLASSIVEVGEPVYGSEESPISLYIVPTSLFFSFYMLTYTVICSFIVGENRDGMMARLFVVGARWEELVISKMIVKFFFNILQFAIILLTMIFIAKIPSHGSYLHVLILYILAVFDGLILGVFLADILKTEAMNVEFVSIMFFPVIGLSGSQCPLECSLFRPISNLIPISHILVMLRSVILKGTDIRDLNWAGYVSAVQWSITFLLVLRLVLKMRR